MDFTFTPQLGVIIGLLVGMVIGWVIGFFDSNNRSEKKIKEAQDQAKQVEDEARKLIARAKADVQSAAPAPVAVDDPGLLRLKVEHGKYALEMDGARVNILTADGRKRLVELLTAIRPYLEGAAPPPPPPSAAQQTPRPMQVPPSRPVVDDTPLPPVLMPKEEVQPIPATPFGPPPKKKEEPVPFASLSMVMQIDSVLQERLIGTPLAGRGIRLTESSGGGVEVYVGEQKFETVDDVPYDEVKTAIRAAITAWEKKAYPGG